MRGQAAQSMPSLAASARNVSPGVSAPAGPPSGPAKLARAPRWAIATAALAALPPLTVRNSLAWVLRSGRGKLGTRNTRSRTAMPVQRTCLRGSAEDTVALLDPGADDVMRNRNGWGNADLLRMLAGKHQRGLFAREPARVLQLRAIDRDVRVGGARVAADHQRHRKRPGLRAEVLHLAADDAGLLQGLAPRGFFDTFARLDEAREARPHVGDEAAGTPEQAALAVDRQHDDDRVGAREMLGLAARAFALPAGLQDVGLRAAVRAEAMARMPGEQRLGFRERRKMIRRDETLYGNRAQIGDEEIVAPFQRFGGFGIERDAEASGIAVEAEKHRLGDRRKRVRVLRSKQRVWSIRGLAHDDQLAADRERVGASVRGASRQERRVAAP